MNDKYLHFDIEDLLSDDAFINWVQAGSQDATWQSWIALNPTIGEKIGQAKTIATSIRFTESREDIGSKDQLWNRIEQSTKAKQVQLPRSKNRYRIGIAVAASLALLLLLRQGLFDSSTIIDAQSQAQVVTLPADSQVDLAQESTLEYEEGDWASTRNMKLNGTATFDVTKGQPFVVKTEQGQVRVLGTMFTVVDDGIKFNVHVNHGRVEVTYGSKKKILTKGQRYIANPTIAEMTRKTNDSEKVENYVFTNAPIGDLVTVLSKMYDIEIETDDVIDKLGERYTVDMSNQDELSTALQSVFWPAKIKYQINNKTIQLSERKE